MPIRFQLDIDKVSAAIVCLAAKDIPDLTVGKMLKLMFLADKYHLVRYGRPITGDRYDALKEGPIGSLTYDLLKEVLRKPITEQGKRLAEQLAIDDTYALPRFGAKGAFDRDQLSQSDMLAIERTVEQFGGKTFEELSAITHAMPAYEKPWSAKPFWKKSATMDFEDFFLDDADAIAGAKEEMIENYHLRQSFAKP